MWIPPKSDFCAGWTNFFRVVNSSIFYRRRKFHNNVSNSKFKITIFKKRSYSWAKIYIITTTLGSPHKSDFWSIWTEFFRVVDSSILYGREKFQNVSDSKLGITIFKGKLFSWVKTSIITSTFMNSIRIRFLRQLNWILSSCRFKYPSMAEENFTVLAFLNSKLRFLKKKRAVERKRLCLALYL